MARGKGKSIRNRNQGYMTSSEPSSPTTASPVQPNTTEKQDSDLKPHLMMMIEDFKKNINNPLKKYRRTHVNRQKPLKGNTKIPLKITGKHNQTGGGIEQFRFQDLKMDLETIKKITKGHNSGDRKPRKEIRSHRCKHHQQNS